MNNDDDENEPLPPSSEENRLLGKLAELMENADE